MTKLTDQCGTPTVRRLPDEEVVRMTGARSGLVHALIYLRNEIHAQHPDLRRIPRHHTAKRRKAMEKVEVLSRVEKIIDDAQKDCDRVLRGHKAISAGRQALSDQGGGTWLNPSAQ